MKKGKYKNVYWYSRLEKWRVAVTIEGKSEHFGYFDTELDGLVVANNVCREHFPDKPELIQKPKEDFNVNSFICGRW